jgi:hypothetical protein
VAVSFGNLELRHYDGKPLRLDKSVRYERPDETYPHMAHNGKPRGLWISVKGENDWPEWCQAEDFYLEEIATEHRVTLWPTANIKVISGNTEFDEFHWEYEADIYGLGERRRYRTTDFWGNPLPDFKYDYIDWTAVAQDYDGIIIAPYLFNRRLDGPSWYYGWDAASGCVWNLNAIRKIEWMIPELEELKRKMARWIDVAVEQANNRMLYGTDNPGGHGRQHYPITSPFFPSAEQDEKGLAPWTTTTTTDSTD